MVFPTVGTTLFPNGAMIRTLALSMTSNRLHDVRNDPAENSV